MEAWACLPREGLRLRPPEAQGEKARDGRGAPAGKCRPARRCFLKGRHIATSIEQQIWQLLTEGTPVVVTSHERQDGDALGAGVALWHALRNAGVQCSQFYEPPLPAVFEFLPGLEGRARSVQELPERFQLVVLDAGSLDRVGALAHEAPRAVRIINIDHHRTNSLFGHVNYVDPRASCCGEMVYGILRAAGVALTPEIAGCLFTAIATDTGRFSYANTTPQSLEVCAALMRAGARPWELADRIYCSRPPSLLRLEGMALGSLRLEAEGRIATMEITRAMYDQTGTHSVDTQEFADLPLSIRGVQTSALLKELEPGPGAPRVKVSLRSRPSEDSVDVCAVAEAFGGGGHRHAAGCELHGSLPEARRRVVEMLRRHVKP